MNEIAHEASVDAGVNGESLVRLYNAGRTIFVPEADVGSFLADGWTRETVDPKTGIDELKVLADTLVTAFHDLLDEAEKTGGIDPDRALSVAQAAFTELAETAGGALQAIQQRYPLKQAEGVTLSKGDEQITVDPGQVADHVALGWSE